MKLKKVIYLLLGLTGLVLACVGAVLPMLPSFPFACLSAYGFGKSSERLDKWFKGTKIYKDNLESYIEGRGMKKSVKKKVLLTISILMGIAFVMMKKAPIGRMILFLVWLIHVYYFLFKVKDSNY